MEHLPVMTSTDARPEPESDDKVDSPADLDKRSWLYVLRKTAREFSADQCTDLAAALTYYAVLAMFPAAIALTSLLGLVGQDTEAVDQVLDVLTDVGAGGVVDSIGPTLKEVSASQSAGLGLVLGLAGALWSASGYVGAFGRAMNRIYEVGEGRPVWKLRPVMLALTAVLVVLVAVALLGLAVSGPVAESVGSALGLGSTTVVAVQHRQVAGDPGRGRPDRGAALLRDAQRAATEVPLDQHRGGARHPHLGTGFRRLRLLRLQLLLLRQDLWRLGGSHRLPAVVVADQSRAPLRCRARCRARARS